MDLIEPVEKLVDIEDARISFLHYGSAGPPVILIHATGFLPWLWHPIAQGLSEKYQVFAPYFCDYRCADPEAGGLSWRFLARDLVSFCRELNIASPFMVGHSMGGAVMTIASGRFNLPVRKMVLIEPILLPHELYQAKIRVEDHPLAGKSIRRKNGWSNAGEARAYLKSKPLFAAWDEQILDLYVAHGMVPSPDGGLELACHPRQEAALFMGSMAYDPWPYVPNVNCPVLVMEGEHTENKGFIDYPGLAGQFPRGHYVSVDGAGHLIPMEKPHTVLSIIRSFFEEK